jgi:hypothetical protein
LSFSSAAEPFDVDPSVGIWANAAEIAGLPMSGDAWDDILAQASGACATPDLTDKDDPADGCVFAKAIVSTRLFAADPQDSLARSLRDDVLEGLAQMMDEANWCENDLCPPCLQGPGPGCTRKSLAVGRNLGAYLAAADLIGLGEADTPSRDDLIAFLEGTGEPTDPEEIRIGILDYEWIDAGTALNPGTRRRLRETHAERPNNWGGHACASSAAAAILLEDSSELLEIYEVEVGFLGDCTQGDCSQFEFGDDAADWTCDQTAPEYGINEGGNDWGCLVDVSPGLAVDGMDLSGVQVDDMRRGGRFPAGCNASPRACIADVHIWEGLQGRISCALILRRQGLDLFSRSRAALRRSYEFQHRPIWSIAGVPGQPHPPHIEQDGSPNDDAFLAYIVNHVYAASFPLDPAAGGPGYKDFGKGFGWTRYTLGEHPCSSLAADSNFDGVCDAEVVPTVPAWGLAVGGAVLMLAARAVVTSRSAARSGR